MSLHQIYLNQLNPIDREYEEQLLEEAFAGPRAMVDAIERTRGRRTQEGDDERDPLRYAREHSVPYVRDFVSQLLGERPELSDEDRATLSREERVLRRNQPLEPFAPGSLGSDMRHNPYGLDTRTLNTALGNLIRRARNSIRQNRAEDAMERMGPAASTRAQQQEFDEQTMKLLERAAPNVFNRLTGYAIETDLIDRREDRDDRMAERDQEYRLERERFVAERRERQARLESRLRNERETNTPDGRLRNYSNFRDYVNTVLGTNILTNRVNSLERAYANVLAEWTADSKQARDTLKELERARQQLEIANRFREDMIHRSMTSGEVPEAGNIREAYEKELQKLNGSTGSYRNAPWSDDYDPKKEEDRLRVLRDGLGQGTQAGSTGDRPAIDVSDLFN